MSVPRCLLIEPDPQLASSLSGIVSRHGLQVILIADPFAALRMLRTESFDLVLYDVSTEGVDHDLMLETLQRDLPAALARMVLVTMTRLESSRLPAGVPVVGPHDLQPLMDYLKTSGR
jgi:DNA-binding response OmpR family regulator